MDETALFVTLQRALDSSKGAATWSDIKLALMRAKEAKIREHLNSVFSGMDLATLVQADAMLEQTIFSKSTASVTATPQPAAIKAPPAPLPKRK